MPIQAESTILDHLPDIVVKHTLAGQVQYVSSAYTRILGCSGNVSQPDNWYSLLHPEDTASAQEFYQQLATTKQQVNNYRLRNAQGEYLWFEIHARVCADTGDNDNIVSVARCSSQRCGANDTSILLNYPERVHQAYLGIIGRLLSSMIHELNQPVSAIMNYMSGCLRRLDNEQVAGEVKTLLVQPMEQVKKQAERVHQTLQGLRNFVELNELRPTQVNINQLLQRVLFMLDGQIQAQRVVLKLHPAATLPTAYADPVLLEQAVMNLLRYVMETLRGSDLTPRHISVYTQHLVEQELVQIRLQYREESFTPAQDDHKYPFFANEADQAELSISQLIIHAHNSTLEKTNQPNNMTEYSFTLPIIEDDVA